MEGERTREEPGNNVNDVMVKSDSLLYSYSVNKNINILEKIQQTIFMVDQKCMLNCSSSSSSSSSSPLSSSFTIITGYLDQIQITERFV